MNRIDFSQNGGFPFDKEIFAFMQDISMQAAQAAALGGQNFILSGCEVNGSNVSNGWVVVAGEILPFLGGLIDTKVLVIETTEGVLYEGETETRQLIKSRYATFGDDGETALLWADFKRNKPEGVLARLERLERIAAPFLAVIDPNDQSQHRGGMILWKKPAILIPDGWQEVEDWRGRLPMGYNPDDQDFDTVGEIGGQKDKVLSTAEMPAHNHANGSYNRLLAVTGAGTTGGTNAAGKVQVDNAGGTIQSVGGGQAFSLLNPYRIVIFIEYIGD